MEEQTFFMEEQFGPGMMIFYLAVMILMIAALWKVFQKAGKPGWASIIPIYNIIVIMEIIGKPWWWLILMLIPGVNLVIAIWATNLLSLSFGQGVGFTLGLIFLPVIFYPLLGFGNFEYKGPAGS